LLKYHKSKIRITLSINSPILAPVKIPLLHIKDSALFKLTAVSWRQNNQGKKTKPLAEYYSKKQINKELSKLLDNQSFKTKGGRWDWLR